MIDGEVFRTNDRMMTLQNYRRIEEALSQAEAIAEDCIPVTSSGMEIRDEIRALLKKVTMTRIREEAAAEANRKGDGS